MPEAVRAELFDEFITSSCGPFFRAEGITPHPLYVFANIVDPRGSAVEEIMGQRSIIGKPNHEAGVFDSCQVTGIKWHSFLKHRSGMGRLSRLVPPLLMRRIAGRA
jgi:hypothetical protein